VNAHTYRFASVVQSYDEQVQLRLGEEELPETHEERKHGGRRAAGGRKRQGAEVATASEVASTSTFTSNWGRWFNTSIDEFG